MSMNIKSYSLLIWLGKEELKRLQKGDMRDYQTYIDGVNVEVKLVAKEPED